MPVVPRTAGLLVGFSQDTVYLLLMFTAAFTEQLGTLTATSSANERRSSAVAERPRHASCH